ncbi:WG repeat-containing protein [Picosynechococcus sp. NKBG042902]
MDKEGTMVINPQFDSAGSFSEGLAAVRVGDRMGYINKEGEQIY